MTYTYCDDLWVLSDGIHQFIDACMYDILSDGVAVCVLIELGCYLLAQEGTQKSD